MLRTSDDVIRRVGVDQLTEYEDMGATTDAPGFYVFRPYPPGTPLSLVVTSDGRPAVRCLIRFAIGEPTPNSVVAPVRLNTAFVRRWYPYGVRYSSSKRDPYEYKPGDPLAPTPESAAILSRTALPLNMDCFDEYVYDMSEDAFLDENGARVTGQQILGRMYASHCRTLGWFFRQKYRLGSAARALIHHSVWKGQDAAMWLLVRGYDVELVQTDLSPPYA
jgi:hypothetical protein